MIDKARDIALQTLYKIDIEGAYSNIILDEMIKKNRNNLGEKRYWVNFRNCVWSYDMEINFR